jgi:hypothetical protein
MAVTCPVDFAVASLHADIPTMYAPERGVKSISLEALKETAR